MKRFFERDAGATPIPFIPKVRLVPSSFRSQAKKIGKIAAQKLVLFAGRILSQEV